ncbi:hypothetical protein QBC41DRAFT_190154, partial [Cercophora samala]
DLVSQGATRFDGTFPQLDTFLLQKECANAYVLFYKGPLNGDDRDGAETKELLTWLLRNRDTEKESIIVIDSYWAVAPLEQSQLRQYRNGELVIRDLLHHRRTTSSRSGMQYDEEFLDTKATLPQQRNPVRIACPSAQCDSTIKTWNCLHCNTTVNYSPDDRRLYCSCGATSYKHWEFKCEGSRHDWAKYGNGAFLALLDDLQPLPDINILVLGTPRGDCRAAWINGLVKYLAHDSLAGAIAGDDRRDVLSGSFFIQFKDLSDSRGRIIEKRVHMSGFNVIEPLNCEILFGNTLIRFLFMEHFPGGLANQDGSPTEKRGHMPYLGSALRKYKTLHGALVLSGTDSAEIQRRHSIPWLHEALVHFGANVIFAFNNTRGFSYTPGTEAFNLLGRARSHLCEQNAFCFDGEGFRFLAAWRERIDVGYHEENKRGWQHDVAESRRMVNRMRQFSGHDTDAILRVEEVRCIFTGLLDTLA